MPWSMMGMMMLRPSECVNNILLMNTKAVNPLNINEAPKFVLQTTVSKRIHEVNP
jgi:hypothetical protein